MADIESEPLLRLNSNTRINYESSPTPPPVSRTVEEGVIPETATYGRNLGWSGSYILIISRVIGSGIFATPGSITSSVGSVGISLLLWVGGAILSACSLAISLEYGCMLPRSGGDKVYLEFTYQHPRFLASTLVAAQAVLLGFTASNCIVFGRYVLFALGVEAEEWTEKALAVGLLTAITLVHGLSLKTGIYIQNALGWVKVFIVLCMAGAGLYVVIFNPQNALGETPGFKVFGWEELWKDSVWNWGLISTSLFKVSYSYAGLANVNNVLNEVRNPVKTLKSVAPVALLTAVALYLLVNVAYFMVIPNDEIKNSGELIAGLFFERVFGPGFGKSVLPLAIAVSAAGNVMVVTFALARVNQEIARQGFLPYASLLSSSKPFGTPLGGLIVHFIPSLLVIALPPPGDVYAFILDVEGYPGTFMALATAIGLLLLRRRRPDLNRPYKAWLPAVWLRIVVCIALIGAPFVRPHGKGDVNFFYATYAIVGIALILLSVLYWYIWFVALPKWGGYRIEEELAVLEDGTSITKLVRVKKE
ncbi:Low-affinity methionine permease [Lachnellula occidentalis]|uniref:Low-affinity methionine permease n=1 Tax=Lachnellula occidentalis TaxID=215460 RepID=A0A8H8U8Z2_9HELO|nr:Low-affinity methionine permease [Lachnellula occidentalis]